MEKEVTSSSSLV